MYIHGKYINRQISLLDFNQSCGMEFNPNDEWIKLDHLSMGAKWKQNMWQCSLTKQASNIRYPQDFSLLNEAREKLEDIIDYFHMNYHPWAKPHTYRRGARKEYLAFAESKKRTENTHNDQGKVLGYIKRVLEYLESYMEVGYGLPSVHRLLTYHPKALRTAEIHV